MVLVNNPLSTLSYVNATAVSSPAAETAIVSTDVVNASVTGQGQQQGGQAGTPQTTRPVEIHCNFNITAGTGATAIVIRCRQGVGLGGTVIGPGAQTVNVTAGASSQLHFVFRDTSGVPFTGAGTAYTVSIVETGATVAGTVNTMDVEVKQ